MQLMKNDVSVFEDYGPLKTVCLYKISSEGYDYYTIRCRGKNIQVPKKLVNLDPQIQTKTKYEVEDEVFADYLDDYYMDGV